MTESNKPYLIEIICSLADHGVKFIICGGMAAVYHGVERMTMDLDISLDMTPGNAQKFLEAIRELGLEPRAPVPAESLLDSSALSRFVTDKNARVFTFWDPSSPYRQIDVFLTDDQAYPCLEGSTVPARVDGRTVKVLNMEKLLEIKSCMENPRDKDKLDIKTLKRLMRNT
ncbi:MAG: nucleotidyl transferase AbiEii/AbiGii toxin family protein [Desulfobacteraceae bacterium]